MMRQPPKMVNSIQSRPKALVISFSKLHRDPRVLREIEWLRDDYEITSVGITPAGVNGIRHIPYAFADALSLPGKLKRAVKSFTNSFETSYWSSDKIAVIKEFDSEIFDLVIANDIETLPLAIHLAKTTAAVHLDAHEYSPLEFTENLRWRILRQPLIKYICSKYIPLATSASTVCKGIADKYEEEFGKKFSVITNASAYEDLRPSQTSAEKIRLIFHGMAHPTRKTDNQIKMMQFLDDRFELNLMLVGEAAYIESLKKLALPFNNVKFLPPVGTKEIAGFTNQFDVGIYSLPPTNFNNRHALPNKFFEFVQARLAIVIAPSPEMAQIVCDRDLGLVAKDFSPESMADAIKTLTAEKIDHFKAQSDKHAYELSAEKNREIFLRLIEESRLK